MGQAGPKKQIVTSFYIVLKMLSWEKGMGLFTSGTNIILGSTMAIL